MRSHQTVQLVLPRHSCSGPGGALTALGLCWGHRWHHWHVHCSWGQAGHCSLGSAEQCSWELAGNNVPCRLHCSGAQGMQRGQSPHRTLLRHLQKGPPPAWLPLCQTQAPAIGNGAQASFGSTQQWHSGAHRPGATLTVMRRTQLQEPAAACGTAAGVTGPHR